MSEDDGTRPGETAHDLGDGRIVYQRRCTDCDGGLIYSPVRFCTVCGGDGYLVRVGDEDGAAAIILALEATGRQRAQKAARR